MTTANTRARRMAALIVGSSSLALAALLASCGSETRAPASPVAAPAASASAQPQALVFPEDAFRATQPAPSAVAPFTQPPLVRFTIGDGCEVFLVERHALPTVSVDLVFEGGSMDDPPGKEGLASLSLALMGEGTERLDKIAFREALADIAANVSTYANVDQQGVSLTSLTRTLDQALALWGETIAHPGLRESDFDRLVKSRLTALEQIAGAPQRIAARLRDSVAWGPDHPYGRVYTKASIQAISLADCRTYVNERLAAAPAKLYIVGDLTADEVRARIAPLIASVHGANAAAPAITPAAPRAGRIFLVDKPGSAQSMVSVLEPGPPRTAADYLPTSLMSAILGGGFSGRINMNIREKNGYAYGAYGGFQYQRMGSIFTAGGAIRADVTIEALHEILAEVAGIRESVPTEAELSREIDSAVLGIPARFATGSDILGTYKSLIYFGLPVDYYERYAAEVATVDRDAVLAAARAHLDPAELRVLVVGDAASLLPKLQAFARDQLHDERVVVLDIDGKPVGP